MKFRGEYAFLSNMYPCKIEFSLNGKMYSFSCVESAYQAFKCMEWFDRFEKLDGPTAKRVGKNAPLRSDWELAKDKVMLALNRIKFLQNLDLQEKLKNIEGEIVEENSWRDTYWGVCKGVGENHLGKILMKIRDELIAGSLDSTSNVCED